MLMPMFFQADIYVAIIGNNLICGLINNVGLQVLLNNLQYTCK